MQTSVFKNSGSVFKQKGKKARVRHRVRKRRLHHATSNQVNSTQQLAPSASIKLSFVQQRSFIPNSAIQHHPRSKETSSQKALTSTILSGAPVEITVAQHKARGETVAGHFHPFILTLCSTKVRKQPFKKWKC